MPDPGSPPGPVALAFRQATGTVQAINGPVGSGKTSTLFEKFCLLVPFQQPPSPLDGVRRRVITVVHADYRKLWRGPIRTWWRKVPRDFPRSRWTGGTNNPATHQLHMRHPVDGQPVEVTVHFIAIGDDEAEDVMRGYETTDWLLMEADLLDRAVFTHALTRLARAPGREHGPAWHPAVGLDFNAPEFGSYIHEAMIDEWAHAPGVLYVQPPAAFEQTGARGMFNLNPQAENLHNLDPGYYRRQIEELAKTDIDLVRRFVCNQPGYSKIGLAVYAEDYDDHVHVTNAELPPEPAWPLYIGVDAGGDPCAAIIQVAPGAAVRVLEELISEHGTGPDRFGQNLADLLASPRFSNFHRRQIIGFPDPSAFWGGDQASRSLSDQDWVTRFRNTAKIECRAPAPTNALFARLHAVREQLRRAGSEPGLLLDARHCKMLRQGFMQGYQFGRVQRANAAGSHMPALPVKNEFSHIHDALQYAIMGALRYPQIAGENADAALVRRQRAALTDADQAGALY